MGKRAVIGSETELAGHPRFCDCGECRAWREFHSMYKDYREAWRLRMWGEYIRGFVKGDREARARFYREVPMNRHQRRAMEAKTRRMNGWR